MANKWGQRPFYLKQIVIEMTKRFFKKGKDIFLQYVCSFSDLSGIMGRSNMTRLQFYALPESVCTQFAFKSDGARTGLNPAMNGQIVWNYT